MIRLFIFISSFFLTFEAPARSHDHTLRARQQRDAYQKHLAETAKKQAEELKKKQEEAKKKAEEEAKNTSASFFKSPGPILSPAEVSAKKKGWCSGYHDKARDKERNHFNWAEKIRNMRIKAKAHQDIPLYEKIINEYQSKMEELLVYRHIQAMLEARFNTSPWNGEAAWGLLELLNLDLFDNGCVELPTGPLLRLNDGTPGISGQPEGKKHSTGRR